MTQAFALLSAGAGVVLLLVAAFGLFRLPDALSRQHAATKSATLALGLILLGTVIEAQDASWWWKSAAIVVLLFITLPVSSHMLARAAARHAYSPKELRDAPRIERSRAER